MVVGRHAAAEGDRRGEDLAPSEGAAAEHHAPLRHDRAVAGRRGLHEVAARLDRLHDVRRHLLGRDLRRAVRGGVGRDGEQLGAGAHGLVATPRVEDLEGHHETERAGRRAHQAGAVSRDRIGGHARQVGKVREERAIGHVLAEGHPVHLLEDADDPSGGSPRHHHVAERRRGRWLCHSDDERGVELLGQVAQQGRLGRARQRPVEGDHVLGPEDEPRAAGGPTSRRRWRRPPRCRRSWARPVPHSPPPAPTLHDRDAHRAHRGTPVGGRRPDEDQRNQSGARDGGAEDAGTARRHAAGRPGERRRWRRPLRRPTRRP